MNFNKIIYNTDSGIATITLNEPEKLNPLSEDRMEEVDRALTEAENDDDIRVIIIKGAGRTFSAGHDLREAYTIYEDPVKSGQKKRRPSQRAKLYHDVGKTAQEWRHLVYCWKPTIAQVHGYCIEGALYLSVFCDITIAAEDAKLGFQAQRLTGASGITWVTPHMMYLVGPKIMRELYLTGRLVSGKEAEKIGLVNRAVPADKLEREVKDIAETICQQPRDGIAMGKAFTMLAYERMGIGEGLTQGGIGHTLYTNVRFEEDEFNFLKGRKDDGLSETFKKSSDRNKKEDKN
ncbi:enoyl-CoA hydratase/isomerase family protein [Thermodesulfobacteriota bacterium]